MLLFDLIKVCDIISLIIAADQSAGIQDELYYLRVEAPPASLQCQSGSEHIYTDSESKRCLS